MCLGKNVSTVCFKIILASDPKLPYRVYVSSSLMRQFLLANYHSLDGNLHDVIDCSVKVPEKAPFSAVVKYAAEEVQKPTLNDVFRLLLA